MKRRSTRRQRRQARNNSISVNTQQCRMGGNMLLKVRLGRAQKYLRVTEPNLREFLTAAFEKFGVPAETEGVKVIDSSGTELDDDVFADLVKDPTIGILTIKREQDLASEDGAQLTEFNKHTLDFWASAIAQLQEAGLRQICLK